MRPPFARVVNGVDASPYSWPWQISSVRVVDTSVGSGYAVVVHVRLLHEGHKRCRSEDSNIV